MCESSFLFMEVARRRGLRMDVQLYPFVNLLRTRESGETGQVCRHLMLARIGLLELLRKMTSCSSGREIVAAGEWR